MAKQSWIAKKNDNGQAVIYDEDNGKNIAVSYEHEHADLIAAAPDLLEVVRAFLRAPHIGSDGPASSTITVQDYTLRSAQNAVSKATGQ